MAQLKDSLVQGSMRVTDTLYANALNTVKIDTSGDITLISASGDSPSLIFDRGGTTTDWRLIVTSGKLSFQSRTGTNAFTERGYFADNSGAFWASTHNGLTLTAASTGFTIAGGTTSKTLTVSDTITLKTGSATYLAYYSAAGTISGHSLAHFADEFGSSVANKKNELVLGNATAKATNGSSWGQIALYSPGTKGTYINSAENSTGWYTATLQAKTGTIALTSDIPTNLNQLTNGPGYITASSNITGTAANVTGTVAVANGGTGATSASNARTNLGLGSIAVKADTDYVKYAGNVTGLGSSSPHGTVKTWWESTTNVPKLSIIAAYNNSGTEYSFLFSKGNADKTYGSVLRWGYNDRYMYLLRKKAADTWLSSDWEKIYAGYADSAGLATTAEDTTSTLYPIGVTSAATTTLKRDTSITMVGNAITATTYKVTTNATITYNSTSGCLEITV